MDQDRAMQSINGFRCAALFSGPFSHCLQCKWRSNSETAILTMPTISYDDAFTSTPPNLTTIIFSKELGEQEDMETQYIANG